MVSVSAKFWCHPIPNMVFFIFVKYYIFCVLTLMLLLCTYVACYRKGQAKANCLTGLSPVKHLNTWHVDEELDMCII